jgi:hypothetical protein
MKQGGQCRNQGRICTKMFDSAKIWINNNNSKNINKFLLNKVKVVQKEQVEVAVIKILRRKCSWRQGE